MKTRMLIITAGALLCTILLSILYRATGREWMLSCAITTGTIGYHFVMRLLVGCLFNCFMKNQADPSRGWFQPLGWEKGLYEGLKVKKWKDRMPTFDAELFDPRVHTWEQIVGAMCQAELVHEVIVILSFVPIFAGNWFGAWAVFAITSFCAAMLDLTFVILQRYNRPRVMRIMEKSRRQV